MSDHTKRKRRTMLALTIALVVAVVSTAASVPCVAQLCPSTFTELADIRGECSEMSMNMLFDRLGRPYLYVASKEGGLRIYKVDDGAFPRQVASIPTAPFTNADVMNVSQDGDRLFLALGNHFTHPQPAGAAVLDVSNPEHPGILGVYYVPETASGCSQVLHQDNYLYLATMQSGVVVVDAAEPSNMSLVTRYRPDMSYPTPNPDTPKYNVRGLTLVGDLLFVSFDAGGLRVLKVAQNHGLIEVGRYANPMLSGKPRAYNNVVVDEERKLVYAAVDYCGVETLSYSDMQNITLLSWWNPFDCANGNWFASPIHTNELRLDATCNKLYVSGARTEVIVLDVSNPRDPDSCAAYGAADDDVASWAVDVMDGNLAFSYVCAVVPVTSFKTGIRLLAYDGCAATSVVDDHSPLASDPYAIMPGGEMVMDAGAIVFNLLGERMQSTTPLPVGMYYVISENGSEVRFVSATSALQTGRQLRRMSVRR